DTRRLEKAEAKIKAKLEKRERRSNYEASKLLQKKDDAEFLMKVNPILDYTSTRGKVKDVKVENFDISFAGRRILTNADLTLTYGRRYGLVGRNGIGKCFGLGTKLLMSDGSSKRVEDILIDDNLQGNDGAPRRVLSLSRGVGPMYKVIPELGSPGKPFECNDKHILVLKFAGRPRVITSEKFVSVNPRVTLHWYEYVQKTNLIVLRKEYFSYGAGKLYRNKYAAKVAAHKEKIRRSNSLSPDFIWEVALEDFLKVCPEVQKYSYMYRPKIAHFQGQGRLAGILKSITGRYPTSEYVFYTAWMIGFWISRGLKGSDCLKLPRNETRPFISYVEVACAILQWNCVQVTDDAYTYVSFDRGTGNCRFNVFKKVLRELGLLQKKNIPTALMTDCLETVRKPLLAGLMDGDSLCCWDPYIGHYVKLTVSSWDLVKSVKRLASFCGLFSDKPGRESCYECRDHKRHWHCSIYGNELFTLPSMRYDLISLDKGLPEIFHKHSEYMWRFSIIEIGHMPYYGFQVDGNQLVLLDDLTVTHNSTLLRTLSRRELTVPTHISILHVEQEMVGDDTPAIEAVLRADIWREHLLGEEKRINATLAKLEKMVPDENQTLEDIEKEKEDANGQLQEVYQKLADIESDKAESRAASILSGLGFPEERMRDPTKTFSGGWRMRLALARALFCRPDLLLLDEPTNMLDIPAVAWLEHYLKNWPSTLLVVSHDREFLDEVATDILHQHSERVDFYRGNFTQFYATKEERRRNQQREYEAQMQYRQHLQDFIDRWRYNAKRGPQAQSKIKLLEKLPVIEPPEVESSVTFRFPNPDPISPPILQLDDVAFGYKQGELILSDVNLSVQLDSRIAVVGPNGAGKSTLLKLLTGMLQPLKGFVHRHGRLRFALFMQHHVDQLDLDTTAVGFMSKTWPGKSEEEYRRQLGSFGVTGMTALQRLDTLSGGQKSRVAFACLGLQNPHILILDEPTNHLDMDSMDALIVALKEFKGGVILVSHDERFIDSICTEIWVCENGRVRKFEGDNIKQYRQQIVPKEEP
ncbi:7910_t:CDS:2, partial [Paraglomus occultum]